MTARLRGLYLIAASALTGSLSSGQSIAIGAIGGVRATNDFTGGGAAISVSGRYAVGPELDIGLPFHFGIEVDALYRRQAYNTTFSNNVYNGTSQERANSWEFPMLLKYRLPFPLLKPFVEAGYAPRVINGTIHYFANGTTPSTDWPTSQGVVIGGGVQFGIGRLRLSPAVRYTYWNNRAITVIFNDGPQSQSSQNQADFLLGITWKLH
jgi:hypothetical protein